MNGDDAMKKLEISAALLVALIVSLGLTTMPGSRHETPSADRTGILAETSGPTGNAGGSVSADSGERPRGPQWHRAAATVSAAARAAAGSTPAYAGRSMEGTDWIAAIYPELLRIARLEEQDPDDALHGLLPLLASDDPVVRLAALESIADTNDSARLPALLAALDDPAAQIRSAALEALMLHGDGAAASAIESLVYDPDSAVRLTAIDALAALGNPASIHVLAGLLYDEDRRIRINAVAALGEIGGQEAIMYLRQMRHDPDESISVSANAILAEEAADAAF